MAQSTPRYLAQFGKTLIDQGYEIVPIKPGDKWPEGLKDWETIRATPKHLSAWLANGHANAGIGVLTRYMPAVDLDIYEADASQAMQDWVDKYIGVGKLRIGRAPKAMLLFSTDTPFTKVFSASYIGPSGEASRVEILGDGQQAVTHAIHPETQRPYEFIDGDIVDTPRHLLDPLTREQAVLICQAFETLAESYVAAGTWQRHPKRHTGNWADTVDVAASSTMPAGADPLDIKQPMADFDIEQAEALLFSPAVAMLADAGNDEWVRVGQALHHQFEGAHEAFDLWDRWSATASSYQGPEDCEKRWASFGRRNASGRAVTLRSYIKIRGDHDREAAERIANVKRDMDLWELKQIETLIAEAGGDWFDFEKGPIPKRISIFLKTSADAERYAAQLVKVLNLRQFAEAPKAGPRRVTKVPRQSAATRSYNLVTAQTDYSRNEKGDILPTQTNVDLAFRLGVCGAFAWDEFFGEIMTVPRGTADWRRLRDSDYPRALVELERLGFINVPKEKIRDAIVLLGEINTRDTAIEWGESLVWDGVPRVTMFGTLFLRQEDTEYIRAVWRYTWTMFAGRLLVPGIKADMIPILASDEGLRKSTLVEALAPIPETYDVVDLTRKDDDMSRSMRGKLVLEWEELKGLKGRDEDSIKAFVTKKFQTWIPKWKEMPTRYYRRTGIIATTNDKTPLPRNGKARRWLPMWLHHEIDTDGLLPHVEQLWAEAIYLFRKHGVLWQEAEKLAPFEREEFREEDELSLMILEWFDMPSLVQPELKNGQVPFQIVDVLRFLRQPGGPGRVNEWSAGASLRQLGYQKKFLRIPGRARGNFWMKE